MHSNHDNIEITAKWRMLEATEKGELIEMMRLMEECFITCKKRKKESRSG